MSGSAAPIAARGGWLFPWLLLALALPPTGAAPAAGGIVVPEDCAISFGGAGPVEPLENEEGPAARRVRLSGYVDIQCAGFRIQADTVVYDSDARTGLAEGTVVLDWGENRITGSRLAFDLEHRTGSMEDASGWVEPDILVEARKISKLDEERVLLEEGRFTTCTQPIPYWSFRIGRGLFHLDHYAHLRHVRMNVGRVPVIYLPWMLWPIKGERAAGFLFPQWGSSRRYGFFVGEAFFWPFRDNADVTFYADYYRQAGFAGGVELNWLPTERGRLRLTGYHLNDRERDERRYAGRFEASQPLARGWRIGADFNEISDFRYYQDFDRSLSNATATTVLSNLNLVHNGEYTSFNARLARREQFFTSTLAGARGAPPIQILRSTLVQESLPGLELRGRSRALTGSPLFYSFESSAYRFRCDDEPVLPGAPSICRSAAWSRLDVAPRFSLPLRPTPWLSFEGRALLRETYYTAARGTSTGAIDDRGRVERTYFDLEAEMIGPRFYRVYPSASSFSSSFKHVIEPRLLYRYVPRIDEQPRVPIFDERDPASGDLNQVNLALRSRLIAKRPQVVGPPRAEKAAGGSRTGGSLPWSLFPAPVEAPPPALEAPVTTEGEDEGGEEKEGEGDSDGGGTLGRAVGEEPLAAGEATGSAEPSGHRSQAPLAQAALAQPPPGLSPPAQTPFAQAPLAQAALAQSPPGLPPPAQTPFAQAPLAQAPLAQAALAQPPPGLSSPAQTPFAQLPLAQAPFAQAPLAQAPLAQAALAQPPPGLLPPAQTPLAQVPAAPVPPADLPSPQSSTPQSSTSQLPSPQASASQTSPAQLRSSGSSPAQAPPSGAAAPATQAAAASADPVEILNFEISQSYSFGNPLTTRFREERICADGSPPPCAEGGEARTVLGAGGTRAYGPVAFSLHLNPGASISVDLRTDYDLANDALVSRSLSGWYRWKSGFVSTTYFRQDPPGFPGSTSSQVRLGSGAIFLNRKLTLDGDVGYDLERSDMLDFRGRVGYYTQCCGFVVEYMERDFIGSERREIRFAIDLKGIGRFLDPNINLAR